MFTGPAAGKCISGLDKWSWEALAAISPLTSAQASLERRRLSLLRRIEPGEARDQDADEEDAGELFDQHDRAGLIGDRRDVAIAGRRESRKAEVKQTKERRRVHGPEVSEAEGAGDEALDHGVDEGPQEGEHDVASQCAMELIGRNRPLLQ